MKYDFLVFGADGIQGKIVSRDLLEKGYKVFLSDLYKVRINDLLKQFTRTSTFAYVDLRDADRTINVIQKSGADIIVNCAVGDWNLNVYNACLHTRCHCIDLGSYVDMTKKQLALNSAFKNIEKTAITGCGSVPGIGNVMLRYAVRKFTSIHTVEAGFAWDSNIKKFVVPFSIESILEEFIAPATILVNGKFKKKIPLETLSDRYFRLVGTQKVFIAEHPETYTFYYYYKDMGLETVKFYAGFPEHSVRIIQSLINLTFHDKTPVQINSQRVIPDEFLTQMLKRLKMPRGYQEWENLWVEIRGFKERKPKTILMECLVPTLKGWEEAGCNIDTGFPASIIARMIKRGEITKRGSFAPEGVVPEKLFFKKLRERNMTVYENYRRIN